MTTAYNLVNNYLINELPFNCSFLTTKKKKSDCVTGSLIEMKY